MKEALREILIQELKYSPRAAEVTCQDLLKIEDSEIQQALQQWVLTRHMTPVSADGYDAVSLTGSLYYPSALLTINMLRKEPDKAKRLLKGFR